ncbi:hypothetical protein GCM10017083_02370 [Thalassobaculum fulvum]|jgi:hypothetical protein|uniref:SmpA / OmlA family protein n=1 Tax=Thalassobaculum fulvum TaxID=1633335 RepID=A0A918XMP8_9PROT|nr:hypothetical protein [Thalassobaculum fulvum]GHD39835.1 hypothetical protein GCM10017083_02370 [Thalassobaculum fulvum]
MNRLLGALTAAAAALVLAGCVTTPAPGPQAASRPAAGPVRPASTGTAVVTAPPSEAERNPDRLRGLDPDGVARLIGMPDYVRREGGATVWQYHAGACVMDLFWYKSTAGLRLVHYEVRGLRLAAVAEPSSCLGDLIVNQRQEAATS